MIKTILKWIFLGILDVLFSLFAGGYLAIVVALAFWVCGYGFCWWSLLNLLVPVFVALFTSKEGRLPSIFLWFETPDADMFGNPRDPGDGGDKGFAQAHKKYLGSWLGRVYTSYQWQLRNTGQGFSTFFCGVSEDGITVDTKYHKEDLNGIDNYLIVAYRNGKMVSFDLKGGFKYPGIAKRFRFRLGWKIAQMPGLPSQIVTSVGPFLNL